MYLYTPVYTGTYTYDKFFKYFDDSNVVLDINDSATPDNLVEDTEYLFTMMAVSADNWVNIVIQETFIPRNLQEYLDVNTENSTENVLAFAASGASSESLSYIYYYPLEGAYSMRYYETEGTSVDETDFSNYFLSISTGKIIVEDKIYFAISLSSPIGKLLLGKKINEEFVFNGKTFKIKKII